MILQSLELRRGSAILVDQVPYLALDISVQTPSARGATTLVKVKLRNLLNGAVTSKTFKGGEKLEEADLETRTVQFLYRMDDELHFMDLESYEQFVLDPESAGDAAGYLLEEAELQAVRFDGQVITLRLPNTVDLLVVQADPVVKGDTATAQSKPVTLETGLVLSVPPHVKEGDRLRVDTRTGKYVSRV